MTKDELIENFSYLPDWEDKYRYLIELGESAESMPESEKTPENKVSGCMSQVWISHHFKGGKHHFIMDSDAHIVKGLEAVLLILINDKTTEEILSLDIEAIFKEIGLEEHLSPTRRNGFSSMVERIHNLIST